MIELRMGIRVLIIIVIRVCIMVEMCVFNMVNHKDTL